MDLIRPTFLSKLKPGQLRKSGISKILLVGVTGHAAGRPDSDTDLVILSRDPRFNLSKLEWTTPQWGALWG
jgi:hypothetical protein